MQLQKNAAGQQAARIFYLYANQHFQHPFPGFTLTSQVTSIKCFEMLPSVKPTGFLTSLLKAEQPKPAI